MNVSSFDLNHARALHYLLEQAHVARAARRLGITAAAASNALRRLRVEFDDELLIRQGRTLVRTPRAEALRTPAREVLQAAERLLTIDAAFDAAAYRGSFDVTMPEHVAGMLVPRLDRLLSTRAPHASLRLQLPSSDLVSTLRGSLNVAVTPWAPRDAGLASEDLLEDPLVCLLRPGHPLLRGPWSLRRFAAADHLRIETQPDYGEELIARAFASHGVARGSTRQVPSFALGLPLLLGSDRVAIAPASLARTQAQPLGLVTRRPPIALPPLATKLLWHVRHAADPRHAWLRQLVRDAVRARS